MNEPIVYIAQSCLSRSLKPFNLMKCKELQEAIKSKRLGFPESGVFKFKLGRDLYADLLSAWQELESKLEYGETSGCVEVSYNIGFDRNDGEFLIVKDLSMKPEGYL